MLIFLIFFLSCSDKSLKKILCAKTNIQQEPILLTNSQKIIRGEKATLEVKDAKQILSITSLGENKIELNKNKFTYYPEIEGCDELTITYLNKKNKECTITTSLPIATKADVNFLIYISANNSLSGLKDSYNKKYDMLLKDLKEIENAYLNKKYKIENINLIIYLDISKEISYKDEHLEVKGSGIYKVIDGKIRKVISIDEPDTCSSNNLSSFLNYAYFLSSSKKNILDVWGHGLSLIGVEFDQSNFGIPGSCLSPKNIAEGIKKSKIQKFNIINFSACLMMGIEVLYELKDVANAISGSPEFIPGNGSFYGSSFREGILSYLALNYTEDDNEIAKSISSINYESYRFIGAQYILYSDYHDYLCYSAVDQTKIERVINKLKVLFEKLEKKDLEIVLEHSLYYNKSKYPNNEEKTDFLDLIYLIHLLKEHKVLVEDIEEIENAFKEYVIYSKNKKYKNSTGLSIFMPKVKYSNLSKERIRNLSNFAHITNWETFY